MTSIAVDPFAPANLRAVPETLDAANVREKLDPFALPVLGLDLATHTGWALRTRACITSGTLDLTERRREKRGDRLLRLWRWLHMIQRATPISLLAYELVQGHGANQSNQIATAHAYAQFEAVAMMFAARNEIPVVAVHTGTLKKAVTGKGNWPKGEGKPALLNAVRALGFTPDTQDECDALAVLHWATNLRGKS